ncbi:MAG: hypothetical protein AAF578_15390 [Pseudomonadota bacterium]
MGYLKSFSVLRHPTKIEALHKLPESLPWVLYRSNRTDESFLDVLNFRKLDQSTYPLSSIPAIQDLPLEFEPPLLELNELYERLRKKNRVGGFRRAIVNLNILLQELVGGEVLTLVSDDEGIDLVSISQTDGLARLCFRAGAVEVQWVGTGDIVEVSNKSRRLHRIAEREFTIFMDKELPLFGFDADVESLYLEAMDKSAPLPPPPRKTLWQKWKERQRIKRKNRNWAKRWGNRPLK